MYLSDNRLAGWKVPKKWRKVGNILQTVAPIVLAFVPVVGWAGSAALLAAKAIQARKALVAAKDNQKYQEQVADAQIKQQEDYQAMIAQQTSAQSALTATIPPRAFKLNATGKPIPIPPPSPLMIGAVGVGALALILLSRKR